MCAAASFCGTVHHPRAPENLQDVDALFASAKHFNSSHSGGASESPLSVVNARSAPTSTGDKVQGVRRVPSFKVRPYLWQRKPLNVPTIASRSCGSSASEERHEAYQCLSTARIGVQVELRLGAHELGQIL
jgi:hypothetical protein